MPDDVDVSEQEKRLGRILVHHYYYVVGGGGGT
jgi:hypothetical protein